MPTYVTQEKLEELKEELINRKRVIRKEIAERIGSAKELGDLAENFEYHEAKDAQGMNESRIVQLEDMIRDFSIIEETTGGTIIRMGVTFKVNVGGVEKTFQLVGANEANPLEGRISNESPIGSAFNGKKPGDTVEITVPSGVVTYTIKEIL